MGPVALRPILTALIPGDLMRDVTATWVREYIGAPFEPFGRGPAYDCWGLARAVLAERAGKTLPDFGDLYSCQLGSPEVVAAIAEGAPVVNAQQVETPELYDLALIRLRGLPRHIGVYVGGGCVLHINRGTNAVCERADSPTLKSRIMGWYRID